MKKGGTKKKPTIFNTKIKLLLGMIAATFVFFSPLKHSYPNFTCTQKFLAVPQSA